MFLMYCDETNLDAQKGSFLLYGGLVFPAAAAGQISSAVEIIRSEANIPGDYRLKFNPKPENLDHESFRELKRKIIETAISNGARLIVYGILHDLATNPDEARRFGINVICYNFNRILTLSDNEKGLVLLDRFNDEGNQIDHHLAEKFNVGVKISGESNIRLSNILGFHMSAVGQSHLPSVVDIALGSLRFAINAHTKNDAGRLPAARVLIKLLNPMFFRNNGKEELPAFTFTLRPKDVRANVYAKQYKALREFLTAEGIQIT